jgi:hypothetical protein
MAARDAPLILKQCTASHHREWIGPAEGEGLAIESKPF